MANLTDNYYGQPCKKVYTGSTLSQDQKIELESKYPDYEVKEIGHEGDNGYVYVLALFSKATLKTIGNITYSTTSEFQQAIFLNDPSISYETLDELLDAGWYPENTDCAWTDIAVLEDKFYAAFGEDSVFAGESQLIYIEIEPTENMIKENDYFKQY